MMENENLKVTGIYSKFWRVTLVIFSMLLIFVGPTYIPLLLTKAKSRLHHFNQASALSSS